VSANGQPPEVTRAARREERERWALRRLYALTGGFLAFFAVFFVGSLHEWAWYALAGPYLGAAACAAGVVGAGVWWGRG
jgi:hypothetical protein